VTSIGSSAFNGCSNLNYVTIGNSVISIGDLAFYGCSGLTSIEVESGNTKYDSRNNCNAIIESATNTLILGCMNTIIPNSVISIGSSAFSGCSGLTSVTIPNSVTSIGNEAFSECRGLTSVHISDLAPWCNISFANETANPLSYAHHLFLNGAEVTDLVIPNSVTSIGSYTFDGCSGLTSVTIPNSVTSIGDWAFSGCNILLTVLSPTPPTINNIGYCNTIIMVPSGCEEAYTNAEGWKNYNIIPYEDPSIIRFKDQNVKDICVEHWDKNGDGELGTWEAMCVQDIGKTFKNNTTIMKFDEFKYFKSVTSIPEEAFRSCTNLRAITIPNSVTSIGSWAFLYCSSLTSVTIPNSVTTIGTSAFRDCI
jgi:hypothetical protein